MLRRRLAFILLLASWLSSWLWWQSFASPYWSAGPISPIETPSYTPTLAAAPSSTPSPTPSPTPTATATLHSPTPPSPTPSPTPARLVAGKVFLDNNRNLNQDPGEPSLVGITVYLRQEDVLFAQTTTDAAGEFRFSDMAPGIWLLGIEVPVGLELINMAANPIPVLVTELTSVYLPFALAPLPTPEPPTTTPIASATSTPTPTLTPSVTPSLTATSPASSVGWHTWLALIPGPLPAYSHAAWLPLVLR